MWFSKSIHIRQADYLCKDNAKLGILTPIDTAYERTFGAILLWECEQSITDMCNTRTTEGLEAATLSLGSRLMPHINTSHFVLHDLIFFLRGHLFQFYLL